MDQPEQNKNKKNIMKILGDEDNQPTNSTGNPGLNVNLSDAEEVVCEKCGSKVFQEKMMIRKLSKFMTGSDRDSITPIPVIVCAECNHINEMFDLGDVRIHFIEIIIKAL